VGLLYAHLTLLDTYFHTKPKPGMVWNTQQDNGRYGHSQSIEETFVASFEGLTASLSKSKLGGKRPLLDID
jgi:hypothetical protein